MFKKLCSIAFAGCLLVLHSPAQTTNGLITGTITDSTQATVPGAEVKVINEGTNLARTALTNATGVYIVPQVSPGLYEITVVKQGFAKTDRKDVLLVVNQSITLDFALQVAKSNEVIVVTGAPPALNTTNATLGVVIEHEDAVDLPLNGREFTQLALLSPGAAPVQRAQQSSFTVALGIGGISPSVNGQTGQQNNYTMDGVLNNFLFNNVWIFSPPPDAIQEFNVQSHITDAQYGVSSGANINVATRSGGNTYHGAAWEFARNAVLDAKSYFSATRLPYSQNQYGFFFSGHVPGLRKHTWFAAYWEGFRSAKTSTKYASIMTPAMQKGDFSAILGTTLVGTDNLGRPIYKNEIYDPSTSRPDPINPAAVIRDPFPGNVIPASKINADIPLINAKYYNLTPNYNLASGVLPNFSFDGTTSTAADSAGIRIDHQLSVRDSILGRWNRTNMNYSTPQALPGYIHYLTNYGNSGVLGYTHLFGPSTILNLRYAYTKMSLLYNDEAAGLAFNNSIHFSMNGPGIPEGPNIGISSGYTGVAQTLLPLGPQWTNEIHADLSKVIGSHTLGFGGMFYHIRSYNGVSNIATNFQQNGTSVNGGSGGPTGFGPATYDLGLVDSFSGYVGPGLQQTMSIDWSALYAQDQWKASSTLTVTAGLRWDFLGTPNLSSICSGLDINTGKFFITKAFAPLYPAGSPEIGSSGYYYPQYNGFEPRFGLAYQVSKSTVARAAFAMIDDHNHGLIQEIQNTRLTWPDGATINQPGFNQGLPTNYIDRMPDPNSYINPNRIYLGSSSDPHNKIPYAMEYNLGIEQQFLESTILAVDYVGSLGRHQGINPTVNTAKTPGSGTYASRGEPFPQYGGPIGYELNAGNSSYNALQVKLRRSFSSGLAFMASYTWSKSEDIQSDVYGAGIQDFYNLKGSWGPSNYNFKHMFVFSSVYQLPVGTGKALMSHPNRLAQGVLGNWNVGGIVSLRSGLPLQCGAGSDVANVGGGDQRCNKIGDPYGGTGFTKDTLHWLNPASFTVIPYTFGTEHKYDLVGPTYKNVDFNAFKDFPLGERTKIEFRAEFFNLFNHTNFNNPSTNHASTQFGNISGSSVARDIQLAAKVIF